MIPRLVLLSLACHMLLRLMLLMLLLLLMLLICAWCRELRLMLRP